MRVYLYELSEDPKELHFTEKDEWIREAVQATQETPLSGEPTYTVDFELRKSQEVVFLKGKVRLNVGMICSRCANSFDHPVVSPSFQALFTRQDTLKSTEAGSSHGVAYSEPTGTTGEDPDIEVLERDYIELGDVLKEQIYLSLPVKPLCKEGCKGVCPVCGQDQNVQPCQCHRIKNPAMANALRRLRF